MMAWHAAFGGERRFFGLVAVSDGPYDVNDSPRRAAMKE